MRVPTKDDQPLAYLQLNLCRDSEGRLSGTLTTFAKHIPLSSGTEKQRDYSSSEVIKPNASIQK